MQALINLISDSPLQQAALWTLNTVPGFPPVIQTVHILGIAVVMGTVVFLNLRLLGLARSSQSISQFTSLIQSWFWLAIVSNVISGAFFVLARPNRYFNNPVFVWKMGFLAAAAALAAYVFWRHRKHADFWDLPAQLWHRRGIALLSIGLWIMVIMAGRWIAYLEYLQYPLWSMEAFDAGPQPTLWLTIENWPLSQVIAATNWFPLIESIHVIAITLVVGSILWVDLRLLGLANRQRPISIMNREMIPWTWGAFVVAAITGLAMFITRASAHIDNPAMRWKLFLLLLAGLNMAYFHFRVARTIEEWDEIPVTPRQLKLIGASSLVLWCGVMLAGRWIGHIV